MSKTIQITIRKIDNMQTVQAMHCRLQTRTEKFERLQLQVWRRQLPLKQAIHHGRTSSLD